MRFEETLESSSFLTCLSIFLHWNLVDAISFQSKDEEVFQDLGLLLDGCDVVLPTTGSGTVMQWMSENEIYKRKISKAFKSLDGKELDANNIVNCKSSSMIMFGREHQMSTARRLAKLPVCFHSWNNMSYHNLLRS